MNTTPISERQSHMLDNIERLIRGAKLRSFTTQGKILMAMAHYFWEKGETATVQWQHLDYYLPLDDDGEHCRERMHALCLPEYDILIDLHQHIGWDEILMAKQQALTDRFGPHLLFVHNDDPIMEIKGDALLEHALTRAMRDKITKRAPHVDAKHLDASTPLATQRARARRI